MVIGNYGRHAPVAGAPAGPVLGHAAVLPGCRRGLAAWFENHAARRTLRRYARLDPRFAKDIGLTQSEIAMVCRAPFWTALPCLRPPPDRAGLRPRGAESAKSRNEQPWKEKVS